MKLKCPLLLKPLATILQENSQSFYPSEPSRISHFTMRHPVKSQWMLVFFGCLGRWVLVVFFLAFLIRSFQNVLKLRSLFFNWNPWCLIHYSAGDLLSKSPYRIIRGAWKTSNTTAIPWAPHVPTTVWGCEAATSRGTIAEKNGHFNYGNCLD